MTENTRTVWQLARMAEVADPDSLESPGADWLRTVEATAADIPEDETEDLHDWADGLVPVYTHHRWQVFTDLAAWNEDVSEMGTPDGSDTTTSVAGVALYMIAERLLRALLDERSADKGTDSSVRSITIEFDSHLSEDSYQDYLNEVVEAIEQISCDYAAAADNDTYEVKIHGQ